MKPLAALIPAFALLAGGCAAAQEPAASTPPAVVPSSGDSPTLVVAISVDQLSSDLFEQYRAHYTGGLARLLDGAVFPNGYQAQAATETCPGHSTILTGFYPANTGIIANGWADFTVARDNKEIYCAEDPAGVPQQSEERFVASSINLLVPTLGGRLKAVSPGSRNVAISGKDRAALMMAGPTADAIFWWTGKGFGNFGASGPSASVDRVNAQVAATLASGAPALPVPSYCDSRSIPFAVGERTVGTGSFVLTADDGRGFLASPRSDSAVLDIAEGLVAEHALGGRGVVDVLSISLSAADYVGHGYGTNGVESCITVASIDRELGDFFAALDARGTDYVVVLTADHGGLDIPERAIAQGAPDARRVDPILAPEAVGARISEAMGFDVPALAGDSPFGDVYVHPLVPAERHAEVLSMAQGLYEAHPDVAQTYTSAQIMEVDIPAGDPRGWSLVERLRASHYPGRSGDLLVLLQPEVTPIPDPGSYIATHGSPWDYDRRVPILFWRPGIANFEQSLPIVTPDILPTLMGVLGMPAAEGLDGVCRDIVAGAESSCE
ncbi:alkaline phosphatase family protein [Alteriqipengyuania flavescens]|uniref:alkaline phosphatase family protein n=1 Tax=Alteriqipengyuania flavescens TaxID=3053610 RepID=UPI0025B36447|nr:alkaline phosphatase family protein [Alteriqipengyuania flavescens]WJY17854.1 alkaline phosphatase family protein [Alteriqipengyuania flavescens]WJY23795.1 alkaline phosphatase family protein [Alteriqipengyuania flavescens]